MSRVNLFFDKAVDLSIPLVADRKARSTLLIEAFSTPNHAKWGGRKC